MVTVGDMQITKTNQGHTFARHETFHLRDGWLFKGLEAVRDDEFTLYAKGAHHNLGIGINMLKALLYWLQATNLVRAVATEGRSRLPLRLTEIGELIYACDPYLEDMGTLWLLHIELASNNPLATFWYWVFNEFPQRDFTEERLVQGIGQFLLEQGSAEVALQSLKKDARCLLRTYLPSRSRERKVLAEEMLDCPLVLLSLLRDGALQGQYKFQVGQHRNLPLSLFAYALYRFRERTRQDEVVLALEDLRWAPLSPGRLLCLDTRVIVDYLEELEHRTSAAHLTRTAGLNMVMLQSDLRAIDLLKEYYAANEGRYA